MCKRILCIVILPKCPITKKEVCLFCLISISYMWNDKTFRDFAGEEMAALVHTYNKLPRNLGKNHSGLQQPVRTTYNHCLKCPTKCNHFSCIKYWWHGLHSSDSHTWFAIHTNPSPSPSTPSLQNKSLEFLSKIKKKWVILKNSV